MTDNTELSATEAQALVVHDAQPQAIAKVDPVAFAEALDNYLEIQKIIDHKMKDTIIDIKGKKFRTKAYWRAIATVYNVSVGVVDDKPVDPTVGEDPHGWGYAVTCKATMPNGRFAVGDGTCMAIEKQRRNGGWEDATHHNVRGHAHTRAFNRAVSNLVGFGEVSADEMPQESSQNTQEPAAKGAGRPSQPQTRPKAPETGPEGRKEGNSYGEWTGELRFSSGKNKDKRWADMNSNFLEWTQTKEGSLKEMGAKEMARRAMEEAEVVDAEVVTEPPSRDPNEPPLQVDDDNLPF